MLHGKLGVMTSKLSLVFESVSTLPADAQAEATRLLIDLRDRHANPIALTAQQDDFVRVGLSALAREETIDHDTLMRTTADSLLP
jgi:hypothetical protein